MSGVVESVLSNIIRSCEPFSICMACRRYFAPMSILWSCNVFWTSILKIIDGSGSITSFSIHPQLHIGDHQYRLYRIPSLNPEAPVHASAIDPWLRLSYSPDAHDKEYIITSKLFELMKAASLLYYSRPFWGSLKYGVRRRCCCKNHKRRVGLTTKYLSLSSLVSVRLMKIIVPSRSCN